MMDYMSFATLNSYARKSRRLSLTERSWLAHLITPSTFSVQLSGIVATLTGRMGDGMKSCGGFARGVRIRDTGTITAPNTVLQADDHLSRFAPSLNGSIVGQTQR